MALYFEVIPHTFYTMRNMVFDDATEFLYSILRKNKSIVSQQKPFYSMAVKEVVGLKLISPVFKRRYDQDRLEFVAMAREADLQVDMRSRLIRIRMRDADVSGPDNSSFGEYHEDYLLEVPLPPGFLEASKPSARAMTWKEMLIRRQEQLDFKAAVEEQVVQTTRQISNSRTRGAVDDPKMLEHLSHLTNKVEHYQHEVVLLDVEMLMRPALSFGCLCFILVGCPVGIWFSRGDYLSAFITCFLPIVFLYYPLLLCGVGLAKEGRINPFILVCGADALIGLIGAGLFWRLLKN